MNRESQTADALQKELPQIRRITTLEEVRRIEPSLVLPPRAKKRPGWPSVSVKSFLIGLAFFSLLGIGLAIIYRYDKLNKNLHQRAVSLEDKLAQTERARDHIAGELKQAGRARDHIGGSRNRLLQAYRGRGFLLGELQVKENEYKRLLADKSSMLRNLRGDFSVATVQVEALQVQRELLVEQAKKRDERIRQLTTQLLNSIGEQELLVNENIRLQEEHNRLVKELTAERTASE